MERPPIDTWQSLDKWPDHAKATMAYWIRHLEADAKIASEEITRLTSLAKAAVVNQLSAEADRERMMWDIARLEKSNVRQNRDIIALAGERDRMRGALREVEILTANKAPLIERSHDEAKKVIGGVRQSVLAGLGSAEEPKGETPEKTCGNCEYYFQHGVCARFGCHHSTRLAWKLMRDYPAETPKPSESAGKACPDLTDAGVCIRDGMECSGRNGGVCTPKCAGKAGEKPPEGRES